jgi:hypothetical protein
MRRAWGSILFGLLVVSGENVRGQEATLYVATFSVFSEYVSYSSDPGIPGVKEGWLFWASRCSAFNPGKEPVEVSVLKAYGPGGEYVFPWPRTAILPPNGGWEIDTLSETDAVGFALVVAPANAVVTSEVERLLRISLGCGNPTGDSTDIGEGRAPLPVFEAPFPAGARVIAGPVDLGSPRARMDCQGGRGHGQRRVSVALFNVGDAETVFLIRAFRMQPPPLQSDEVGPVLERSITVGAKSVLQVNDMPLLAAIEESGAPPRGQELVWITVEATQPFLTYVSSVFLDPEPATLPFQVFAPHRIQ